MTDTKSTSEPEAEEAVGTVVRTDALTPRQIEATHDAFNRVLAGDYDGDIPIEVYQRAYDKICAAGRRLNLTDQEETQALATIKGHAS